MNTENLAQYITQAIEELKGEDICSINVAQITSVTDIMMIVSERRKPENRVLNPHTRQASNGLPFQVSAENNKLRLYKHLSQVCWEGKRHDVVWPFAENSL